MLVTLAALFIVLAILFLNWARNPYGLEEARLGPKGKEKLPPISLVVNAANYLLFPRHEGNSFVIHLPVSDDYYDPSNKTSNLIKSYSSSVTMYYPEMHGAFHPKNAHLLKCNGYCEGYIRVSIDASGNGAKEPDARKLESIKKDRSVNSPLYRFEDLDNAFSLDDHFQVRYPVIEKKSKGDKSSAAEYLIKRDQNGNVQYLFECSPCSPSPGCSVRFNLSSRPEILVNIRFGRHLMENWEDIIRSVDKKITSWKPVRMDVSP